MLLSAAVIVLPAESTIANVTGLAQVPLVDARKKPPLAATTFGMNVTAVGNDAVIVYGGTPPKM